MRVQRLDDRVVAFLANDVELFSGLSEEEISCEINGDVVELKQGEVLFN